MPTTVHLPAELLKRVDRRASKLGLSRNRYIRGTLERAVRQDTEWSPSFLTTLERAAADVELQQGVAEMMSAIAARRASKVRPPRL